MRVRQTFYQLKYNVKVLNAEMGRFADAIFVWEVILFSIHNFYPFSYNTTSVMAAKVAYTADIIYQFVELIVRVDFYRNYIDS